MTLLPATPREIRETFLRLARVQGLLEALSEYGEQIGHQNAAEAKDGAQLIGQMFDGFTNTGPTEPQATRAVSALLKGVSPW